MGLDDVDKEDLSFSRADKFTYPKILAHIAQKGFQLGSAVGLVAGVPGAMFQAGNYEEETINKGLEYAGMAAVAGVGLTILGSSYKLVTESDEEVKSRVYRLHYNRDQQRTDRFCQIGAAAGSVAAVVRGKQENPWSILGHAATGACAGMLAHAITRPKPETVEQAGRNVRDKADNAARSMRDSMR